MLTGTPNDTGLPEPAYVLAGWGEDDSPESFVVSTEHGPNGPVAVLSLADGAEPLDGTLQELTLELRQGDSVLQIQEVIVSFADQRAVDRFYEDRVDGAQSAVGFGPDTQLDGWLALLGDDGAFSDLSGDADGLGAGIDRLSQLAAREVHRAEQDAPRMADADTARVYRALAAAVGGVESAFAAATSAEAWDAATALSDAVQQAGLLLTGQLVEDAGGTDPALSTAANEALDVLFEASDSYHTVFAGYEQNRDLLRVEADSGDVLLAIGSVEEASYTPNDQLRVELGGAPAFVQAEIVAKAPSDPLALLSFTANIPTFNDTYVDQSAPTAADNGHALLVGNAAGAEQHTLLNFNIESFSGDVPTDASLSLDTLSGGGTNALSVYSDLWGIDAASQWAEGVIDWNGYGTTQLQAGFEPDLASWAVTPGAAQTVDVTEYVQRATIFGDANLNGEFDYAGPNGDIEAFYDAVVFSTAYQAQYSAQALLIHGLTYRSDGNLDGAVDLLDVDRFFGRHGASQGDVTLDGVVDIRDIDRWFQNLGAVATGFGDGDVNFNGLVDNTDFYTIDSALSFVSTGPTDPSLTVRVTGDTASYASAEHPTAAAPQLDVQFNPQITIVGFQNDDSGRLSLEYFVQYGDATNAKLSLHQVVDGVATELFSGETVNGISGPGGSVAGYQHAITSPFVIANPDEDYTLVATITSENGVSRSRTLDAGVFVDSVGNLHVLGGDSGETLTVTESLIDLSTADEVVELDGLTVNGIYANLGAGDDTYVLPAPAGATHPVTIADTRGVDTLDLTGWSAPAIDVGTTAQQTISTGAGGTATFTLAAADAIEVVDAADTSAVVGQGYTTPLLVTSLLDFVDGDHSAGELTLREALAIAEAIDDTNGASRVGIAFDPLLFYGGPQTLELGELSGNDLFDAAEPDPTQLIVAGDFDIQGPGAGMLAISGEGGSRVFRVLSGEVTISDLTIENGYLNASSGAGIYNKADLTLERVVLQNNEVVRSGNTGGRGAAIYSDGGNLTIIDSTVTANETDRQGAGVWIDLAASETLSISGSTFSANTASGAGRGGALFVNGPGAIDVVNSTFSGNQALIGGGLMFSGPSTASITNSTITLNHGSQSVGGLWNRFGNAAITLHNTIVAGNLSGQAPQSDVVNAVGVASSHNVIGHAYNTGLQGGVLGNQLIGSASPGLDPLADNGGPTQTHALQAASVALDAGDNARATAFDQRGDYRRFDADGDQAYTTDVGAYEDADGRIGLLADGTIVASGTRGDDELVIGDAGFEINGVLLPYAFASGDAVELVGRDGDDVLRVDGAIATTALVTLHGGRGEDLLEGSSGGETLIGGLGADVLIGGDGADTLYGALPVTAGQPAVLDDGSDTLFGDGGADVLYVDYYDAGASSPYRPAGGDFFELGAGDSVVADSGGAAPAPAGSAWSQARLWDGDYGFGVGWNLAGVERLEFSGPGDSPTSLAWVQASGHQVTFVRPAINGPWVARSGDPTGSVITYDAVNALLVRTDKYGNTAEYAIAGVGLAMLTRAVDRNGVGREYSYSDHNGDGVAAEIDSVSVVRAGQAAEVTSYGYAFTGTALRVATITDPFGRVVNLSYDNSDRLQHIDLPAVTSPGWIVDNGGGLGSTGFEAGSPRFTFGYDA
ncbi:MAG: choice-of-anchor Q domain-containing protein, partial [Planctomycetota bacterium]